MNSSKVAICCAAVMLLSGASLAGAQETNQKPQGAEYGACPGWGGAPGMMSGGYGPGRMWGYGPGMGPYSQLALSDQQRVQINQIQDQVRQRHWNLMRQMREESIRLNGMMAADHPDPAAVGQQQMKVADIHRQMLESSVDARNRIEALLTSEQKAQLRSMISRRWSGDPGSGASMPEAPSGGK